MEGPLTFFLPMFHQCLQNSAKFTPDGGKISLVVDPHQARLAPPPGPAALQRGVRAGERELQPCNRWPLLDFLLFSPTRNSPCRLMATTISGSESRIRASVCRRKLLSPSLCHSLRLEPGPQRLSHWLPHCTRCPQRIARRRFSASPLHPGGSGVSSLLALTSRPTPRAVAQCKPRR